MDESERVIGGVPYAGLQKRQSKGSEGSFVIIILNDKAMGAKENNEGVFSNCLNNLIKHKHSCMVSSSVRLLKLKTYISTNKKNINFHKAK